MAGLSQTGANFSTSSIQEVDYIFLLCFLLFWIDLLPHSMVVRAVRGDPARAGATFAGGELQGCFQGLGTSTAALTSSATGCPAAEARSLQKKTLHSHPCTRFAVRLLKF